MVAKNTPFNLFFYTIFENLKEKRNPMDENEVKFNVFLERTLINIETERKKKKISYQELAYRSNIDKSNIISIINKKKT